VIHFVLRRPGWVIGAAALAVAASWLPYSRLGSEFMPPLVEGAVMDMPSVAPGLGTAQVRQILE
jgi:Cu(I)/Ag(I) efflux system membrane protein CusA/SilA